MKKEDIIKDFDAHLGKSNRQYYSEFYIDITNDIEKRLFGAHKVPKENHWWIYSPADTEDIARDVEKYYLEKSI